MTKFLQYVIVRFRPFPETGEFANVGIVLLERNIGLVAFKLTPKRFKRVAQFFSDLPNHLFAKAISNLEDDFDKLIYLTHQEGSSAEPLQHLLRTRESILQFSEPRAIRATGENAALVTDLYDRYIKRSFISQEYREEVIAREIRQILHHQRIRGFKAYQIDDELMPIRFPLASNRNGLHVIKPLAFDHKSTVSMMDHAATWRDRIKYLIDKGQLLRKNILLPIEGPASDSDQSMFEAFNYAKRNLSETGATIVDHANESVIIGFAAEAAHPSPSIFH